MVINTTIGASKRLNDCTHKNWRRRAPYELRGIESRGYATLKELGQDHRFRPDFVYVSYLCCSTRQSYLKFLLAVVIGRD